MKESWKHSLSGPFLPIIIHNEAQCVAENVVVYGFYTPLQFVLHCRTYSTSVEVFILSFPVLSNSIAPCSSGHTEDLNRNEMD